MTFQEAYLKEFDHEAATTRRLLERVPDGKFDWAPHASSTKLGGLAGHIAQIPAYAAMAMKSETVDTTSPEAVAARPAPVTNTREVLARWDKSSEALRAAVSAAPDEDLDKTFTLRAGEHTIFSMPRRMTLRTLVMSHMIHHRGQLSAYLRMLEVPIPSIYGPSGDEK